MNFPSLIFIIGFSIMLQEIQVWWEYNTSFYKDRRETKKRNRKEQK